MGPQKINIKERLSEGEIDLSMSDLQDVPVKDIAVFKKAFSLDLSNNHLKSLPVNFATLTHLTKLDLSKNQLSELPDNFGDLVKLKYLDLYQNQLQYLPLSFSKLKALKWLDLKDNPLVPAVAKVSGQCLDTKQCQTCARDVVNFFNQIQDQVDTNLEKRQKQRQKQIEANQQQQQQQQQKETMDKKSKKVKDQKPKQKPSAPPSSKSSVSGKKNKKTNGSDKPAGCSSCSCLKSIFVLLILGVLALFVLTSIKCQCTRNIEALVTSWYLQGTNSLPPNLQVYSLQAGDFIKFAHAKTGNVTLDVIQYVKNTDNFVNAYNALGELIENLMKMVKEQYKKYVS